MLLGWLALICSCSAYNISTISPIPTSGFASLTHYDLPLNFVASCGCLANSSLYPTAALSQAAYGASLGGGPGCGRCFNITLLSSLLAIPEYVLPSTAQKSIVVKITDKCPQPPIVPAALTWCGATPGNPNKVGQYIHFDVASPSTSIPASFFPAPPISFGYDSFGGWKVSYSEVSCRYWAGFSTENGIDPIAPTGCCPANPLFGDGICKATSLVASSATVAYSHSLSLVAAFVSCMFMLLL